MPTIDRWRNCRVYFWSLEGNEPAHVHIDCAEKSTKIWLHDLRVAYNDGFSGPELRRLVARVREMRGAYREAWDEHFS